MTTILTAVVALHLLFAGLWAGGVLFMTWGVLPLARAGDIDTRPTDVLAGRLRTLSRISALVMLVTGGHLAATRYTGASLLGSTQGNLVLAMVVLWLLLAAFVEIGSSRLTEGINRGKVRTPAHNSIRFYQAASLVAVVLLLVGGVLAAS